MSRVKLDLPSGGGMLDIQRKSDTPLMGGMVGILGDYGCPGKAGNSFKVEEWWTFLCGRNVGHFRDGWTFREEFWDIPGCPEKVGHSLVGGMLDIPAKNKV